MHDKRIVREGITIVFYVNVRLFSVLFPSVGYTVCTVYTTASTVYFLITRNEPSTSGDMIEDCTHVPGPSDDTRSLLSMESTRGCLALGTTRQGMRGNLRPHQSCYYRGNDGTVQHYTMGSTDGGVKRHRG